MTVNHQLTVALPLTEVRREEEENKGGDSGCANKKVPKPVQEKKRFEKNKKQNRAAGRGETKVC